MPNISTDIRILFWIIAAIAGAFSAILGNELAKSVIYFLTRRGRPAKRPLTVWIAFFVSLGISIGFGAIAAFAPDKLGPTPEIPVTPAITPESSPSISITPTEELASSSRGACDEKNRTTDVATNVRFRRWQGVSLFAVETTPPNAILSNIIRAITVDRRGLWLGYFPMQSNTTAGLGLFDKSNWYNCNVLEGVSGKNVNDITIDEQGGMWVALEHAGVAYYDGESWTRFTREDGLISEDVFRITIDSAGAIWVGTWDGVAKFDGNTWSTPYSAESGILQDNHVGTIVFDQQGNIWLGHLDEGISLYNNTEGKWEFIQASENGPGGNQVRAIAAQAADSGNPEAIWVGTADGGLSQYKDGTWTQYHMQDGLPSEDVKDVKIDPLNRVWVATSGGVAYLQDGRWIVYDTYDTARIAFGVDCADAGCPYDEDHILTATSGFGFTHSRLPRPNMLDVPEVCFIIDDREPACVTPVSTDVPNTVDAVLPTPVLPGQKIRFEIKVSPRSPYELREDRGDLLSFAEESDANLFGAFTHITVKGTTAAGQTYTFTDYDSPMIVPETSTPSQEFSSTWRVWLHTRYAGPLILLRFVVHKQ